MRAALARVEQAVGRRFGDPDQPLLVSVRSGARVSMPGMMDTVLNLGLNDATVAGLAAAADDARFAWDSYRRFIQMYGAVVLGVEHHRFEEIIEHDQAGDRRDRGHRSSPPRTGRAWSPATSDMVAEETGKPFPQDPEEQLWGAIGAVFGSWMNPRAITYRRLHDIPAEWGTAVNVQAMVFGNMGEDCATGVCFTRDPSTGENVFYGEYLVNAQGEDVVAGIRTPQPMSKASAKPGEVSLEEAMPAAYAELLAVRDDAGTALPRHAGHRVHRPAEQAVHAADPQRQAHRRGRLRIAVEMAHDGLIDQKRGGAAGQPRGARPVAAPDARSRRRRARCWPRGCRPARARPAARWCSAPTRRKAAPPRARR